MTLRLTLARRVIFRPAESVTGMSQSNQPLHNFAARCPKGHRPAQTVTLDQLRQPGVEFYCGLCEKTWVPSSRELERAVRFAEASEDVFDTPLSAA